MVKRMNSVLCEFYHTHAHTHTHRSGCGPGGEAQPVQTVTFPLCAGMVGALGSPRSSPESVATGEAPSPDLVLVQH